MGMLSRECAGAVLLCLGVASGCGPSDSNNDSPVAVKLSGAVQKGPFVLGSTINVSPLDSSLNSIGQVFNTQTTDDLGQFRVDFMASGRVALEGTGFYYNEVSGALSSAPLTLRALYDIQAGGAQNAYINLVTHLTFQRIKQLVSDGAMTAAATAQAEQELRTAIGIGPSSFMMSERGITLNILGGDTNANAYLFALSAVVAQAAADKVAAAGSGSLDATLQELLNTTAIDLSADGMLQLPLHQAYLDAQQHLDVDFVATALRTRLTQLGSSAMVPDLNRMIDSDGDGVVNADDNCPLVANPTQTPVPDGLCKLTTQGYKGPSGLGSSMLPVDLKGDQTYSVLAVAQQPTPALYLSKNDGSGALGMPTAITLGSPAGAPGTNNCCTLTALEMNNDGRADLFRIDTGGWMAVYPGDGMGGFGAPQAINKLPTADMVDGKPFATVDLYAIADFKKDGLPDLIGRFAGSTGLKVVLVAQQAGGQWSTPTIVSSMTASYLAAADMDKDGKSDMLMLDGLQTGFHLYFGKGDGLGGFTINSVATFPANFSPAGIMIADFNGDTFPDVMAIASSTLKQDPFSLFLSTGNGAGSFSVPVLSGISLPLTSGSPVIGDFSGSGKTAVLTAPVLDNVQLWTYQGGQFVAGPLRPFVHLRPSFAIDMDKNGKLDLVGPATNVGNMNVIDVALQH